VADKTLSAEIFWGLATCLVNVTGSLFLVTGVNQVARSSKTVGES